MIIGQFKETERRRSVGECFLCVIININIKCTLDNTTFTPQPDLKKENVMLLQNL